jgi:tripartite-type tricarboxylate transporter receptor subunit TctC
MNPIARRDFLTLACAAAATPALSSRALADAWPSDKVIRAVVPFGPGSTIDIIGRVVLDPLSSALGQTIVVENRGGAGGSIGSAMVAKSDPDGYTLLINASAHTAAPAVYPNLTYDPSKDFAGVAVFGVVPNVLLIAPAPAKTPRPIIERLHAEVGKALALPAVQEKLAAQGVEPMPLSPQEFDAMIAKEIVSNITLVKAAGLTFN